MPQAYSYLRLSSAEQARGDGLKRQLDQTRAYALAHGLTLVEKDELRDIGVSAFKGANATEGALAGFLEAIRRKKVEVGSFLLIENLDRLSRQQVFRSFALFAEIVSAGIKIVTLSDQRVYDTEPDLGDMVSSIVTMERAHQKSKMRSFRIGAAWAAKRAKIDTAILTCKTKGWLRARTDKTGFDLVPARVKVVRQIFSMCADLGLGADAIARRLNKQKVPPFAGKNGWHKGPVLRLLKDRSVLGEFTPHQMVDGVRTPTKQIIPDYFPPIIDVGTFHKVRAGLSSRRQGGGGPKGVNVANLFAKLTRCGSCGSSVHMVNRGQPRGSRSLVCDGAKRGVKDCAVTYWPATAFERTFLSFVEEINLAAVTGDAGDRQERDEAEREAHAVDGRLQEVRLQRDRAFDLLTGDEPTDYLRGRLRDLDAQVAALEQRLGTLRDALATMAQEVVAFAKSRDEISSMIKLVQSGGDTFAIRAALSARIKDLVAKIFIWPAPVRITILEDPGVDAAFADAESGADFEMDASALRDCLGARTVRTEHADKCFSIIFKNDVNRLVAPGPDDSARVIDTSNGRIVGSSPAETAEIARLFTADLDEQLANRERRQVRNSFGSAALIDRVG
jgi:DNA invertase Pin-like site-specific DNA recombinase